MSGSANVWVSKCPSRISKCLSQQMSRPSQQMSNQQMSVSKCPVSKWKISKVPDTYLTNFVTFFGFGNLQNFEICKICANVPQRISFLPSFSAKCSTNFIERLSVNFSSFFREFPATKKIVYQQNKRPFIFQDFGERRT